MNNFKRSSIVVGEKDGYGILFDMKSLNFSSYRLEKWEGNQEAELAVKRRKQLTLISFIIILIIYFVLRFSGTLYLIVRPLALLIGACIHIGVMLRQNYLLNTTLGNLHYIDTDISSLDDELWSSYFKSADDFKKVVYVTLILYYGLILLHPTILTLCLLPIGTSLISPCPSTTRLINIAYREYLEKISC